ncbi:MAG: type II/IV secretion system ATPase subunit, partial [Candidatus Lokiarchaeota archaeon]|nr:type II/IV secretion system ATPase subunit [Candidatus Lokiarchaeota archaeon]
MTLPNEKSKSETVDEEEEKEEVKAPILEESYPLIPPFSYAQIKTDPKTRRTMYHIIEVPLKKKESTAVDLIKEKLIENIDIIFGELEDNEEKMDYLRGKIEDIWKKEKIELDHDKSFEKVFYYISRDFIGFGRLEPVLRDATIEDISCDGVSIPIYIWHRKYESIPTNLIFRDEAELNDIIVKIAQRSGRHISIANPILDASLPDGSRVQLTYGKEITQRGSTFTIRKFRADPLTITDLLQYNTLNTEMAAYLWYIIEHRHSALIAGGIASGKTTLLNCLSMFIRPGLKLVTIEDTAELNIPHENVISSIARTGLGVEEEGRKRGSVTLFDLLKASLRQRPDYII